MEWFLIKGECFMKQVAEEVWQLDIFTTVCENEMKITKILTPFCKLDHFKALRENIVQ